MNLGLQESCLLRLRLDTLSKEQVVFSKMLYRGNNQHKHDKSFQKMNGVLRQIKKYLQWNLSAKVEVIGNQLNGTQNSVENIPSHTVQLLEEVYPQLLESATFVADLLEFIEDTWSDVSQRLTMGHFIPFNTIMLTSLSRIWVCLRVHLLGISETYSFLKNTVPQMHMPVSRVVDHLKERHRRYLSLKTPAVHLTPPLMSSATWKTPESSSSRLKRRPPMSDTGVAIQLTEKEQQTRARDFQCHTPSTGSDWQPLPRSTGTYTRDRWSTGAMIGGKMKRIRRGLRGHHRKRLCQTQPNVDGLLGLTPKTSMLPAEGERSKGDSSSQMTPVSSVSLSSHPAKGDSSSQMTPVTSVSSTRSSQPAKGGSPSPMTPATSLSLTPSSQPAEGDSSSHMTPVTSVSSTPSLQPVRDRKMKLQRRRGGRGGRHKKKLCQTQPNVGARDSLLEWTPTTSTLPALSSQPAEGEGSKDGSSSQMTPVTSETKSQLVETKEGKSAKNSKKSKKKKVRRKARLKLKGPYNKTEKLKNKKNCLSGNFREIILKCSDQQKRIIGSKIWKKRMTKKIAARQQREGKCQ